LKFVKTNDSFCTVLTQFIHHVVESRCERSCSQNVVRASGGLHGTELADIVYRENL